MKISFLLPTRDRLDYLKLAVETVRRQDRPEWEIVISDNDSTEDIRGFAESLNDSRVVYSRTPRFLPVTDNWNTVLALSSGDYVLMLGDDDGLLPGYVGRMFELIERFERPDVVYTGALLFSYPGVDPEYPNGFLAPNTHAEFFGEATEPFLLDHERALAAVCRALDFRLAFNFNMQLSLVSRKLVERVRPRGEFFQSAFPDYYATCVALLEGERVVADPRAEVVIGVTPKSYGYFHLNRREDEGRAFLEAGALAPNPGSNINEGWLAAMEALAANYGSKHGLRVNRRRHRMLQAGNVYGRRLRGSASYEELAALNARLSPVERVFYRAAGLVARLLVIALPARLWALLARRVAAQFPDWRPPRTEGYANVLEVFERRLTLAEPAGRALRGRHRARAL
ncbi:MAG: glycosyltransferase [Gaiellaceae bacterium]